MYLYLLSSHSSHLFDNTLTKFTNKLPKPIEFPRNETWSVALEYIILSETFAGDFKTDVIYINCSIIEQSLVVPSAPARNRTIGVFAYHIPTGGSSFTHNFLEQIYYPIENSYIDRISFNITDASGKTIPLKHGNPTLLKLHLKKMSAREFNISCDSSASLLFPENTGNDFTIALHKELKLFGDWEVAVSSITHPAPSTTLFDKEQYITWKTDDGEIAEAHEIPINFTEIRRLIDYFLLIGKISDGKISAWIDPRNRINLKTTVPLFLDMSKQLALLLQVNSKFLSPEGSLQKYRNMVPGLAIMTDEDRTQCVRLPISNYILTDSINLQHRPVKYLIIYADFIEPSVFSDKSVQVLKIAPLPVYEKGIKTTIGFILMEYHKVSNSYLKYLKFQIYSNLGDPIEFKKTDAMVISLKFKRVN
jgi:hypothetical protein